jgi:signal transduction histidine kinase
VTRARSLPEKSDTPSSAPDFRQRISNLIETAWNSGGLVRFAVIVLALAPIASAGFYSYKSTETQFTTTVMARRESFSILVATVLAEKLDRAIDLGVSLATRVRFRQLIEAGQWTEAVKIMEKIPAEFPHIDRLYLADPRGVVMADTPSSPGVRGSDRSTLDWYRGVVRTGKPYVSEIYKRLATPRINVVSVAVPIHNQQKRLMGILVLQIGLEAFSTWFKDMPIDSNWQLYVVDQNGKAAFHPQYASRPRDVNTAAVPEVQRERPNSRSVDIEPATGEHEERVSAYTPVERYGWSVILDEPTRTAFASRDTQLRRFSIIFGLMLLMSGVAAYLIMRVREDARHKTELEQKVAERTDALKNANKELESFSYSVSHDLRAPLRSIDGFSRILMEDCADKLSADGTAHLQRIRAAAQRMSVLIDDLLKLSRVTRSEMTRAQVDLSAIAKTIVDDIRRIDPDRQVTVDIQSGLEVIGDASLLRVVLENLLSNAWKFTGKTNNARIELGSFIDTRENRRVYFVRDNGAGFDDRYTDKLFGAFQRLHGADEFPGTGVGLATVQRIVRRHGGKVWAESKVGEGAAFYFMLDDRSSTG